MKMDHILWVEKYRPKTVEECILPDRLKIPFKEYVKQGNIPSLMLSGGAGVGKTTIAKAMCNEIGCEYLVINGSDESGIDVFRTKIKQYASSMSLDGKRKVIIIDEADYLNCLDEDEFVKLSDGSKIKLKDMDSNLQYQVLSFNTENRTFESNNARVVNKTSKLVYSIELDCGKVVNCTDDHPIMCEDSDGNIVTRTISQGLDGYKVIVELGKIAMSNVKSIVAVGVRNVVDLTVENNHTFVTGSGIVVHNCNSTQPALRNAMEEFASNCSFIFTCNYKNRIIEPLHSRCAVIEFTLKSTEKSKMASLFFKRIQTILDTEKVEYENSVVAGFVNSHFPDFRRVLNELQRYSKFGKIDSSLLTHLNSNIKIDSIVEYMKKRDFTALRKWIATNDVDPNTIFREIFDSLTDIVVPSTIPNAVLLMADYQYKHAFVADPQINLMAFFLEMMQSVEFK